LRTRVDVLEHAANLVLRRALGRRLLQELGELLRLEPPALVGIEVRDRRHPLGHHGRRAERQQQRDAQQHHREP